MEMPCFAIGRFCLQKSRYLPQIYIVQEQGIWLIEHSEMLEIYLLEKETIVTNKLVTERLVESGKHSDLGVTLNIL